jgi:hypothetical protein
VVTRRTLQSLGSLVGVNQLYNQTTPATASTRVIVSPNDDTLYSVAVVDLRSEPMVLTVPDVTDRYWTYQFIDAWTNAFDYIGTRTTAGKGGTFVIVPPGWTGQLPTATQAVPSPTPLLFLLGRYSFRDASDVANVVALQRTLVPLHTLTGGAAPTAPPALGVTPGPPAQTGSDGATFFDELGDALALDGPAASFDQEQLARFASLGIGAGLHPAAKAKAASDTASLAALQSGVTAGLAQIQKAAATTGGQGKAWTAHLDIGTYTDNFLLRALVAQIGWGANVPAEAVYAFSQNDSAGAALTGAKNYVVHFAPGALPPVAAPGFWSLTMYGTDRFFVANPIGRYSIGDHPSPPLIGNPDGSLDLYVQAASPAGHESNWLPSPSGAFNMVLRLYLPDPPVLAGTYVYPTVTAQ